MSITHTKGPWVVSGKQTIRSKSSELIATAASKNGPANAALIAAAPDLFDALCVLVLSIDGAGPTQSAMQDARSVIGKATGEKF